VIWDNNLETTSPHQVRAARMRHSATLSLSHQPHIESREQTLQTFPSSRHMREKIPVTLLDIIDYPLKYNQWQKICSDHQSIAPCASWIVPSSRRKFLSQLLASSTTRLFQSADLIFSVRKMSSVSRDTKSSDLTPTRLMQKLERNVSC
jgi:hypothetical protein